jgi:hypothetical protein
MRFRGRQLVAALLAALAGSALAACQVSDLPMPPNGPQNQFFSTNNALIRIVNGSPTAGSACTVGGQATTCVDIVVDGSTIARGVPYPTVSALNPFAILPYVSIPSGPVLIQIFQAGTSTPVFEPTAPLILSAGKKYSFVLGGNAPIPPSPFFPGYLYNDGLFNSLFGNTMADFHNASPNAGSLQFFVTCASCPGGGQNIGNPVSVPTAPLTGGMVGPVNLVPSSNYALGAKNGSATKTITATQLDGTNTGGVLPDPVGNKPNVSVYTVDLLGAGAANFQVIAVQDTNG